LGLYTIRYAGAEVVDFRAPRFKFKDILNAYETFSNAATTQALKVIIEVS
jgi:hypothetical protein